MPTFKKGVWVPLLEAKEIIKKHLEAMKKESSIKQNLRNITSICIELILKYIYQIWDSTGRIMGHMFIILALIFIFFVYYVPWSTAIIDRMANFSSIIIMASFAILVISAKICSSLYPPLGSILNILYIKIYKLFTGRVSVERFLITSILIFLLLFIPSIIFSNILGVIHASNLMDNDLSTSMTELELTLKNESKFSGISNTPLVLLIYQDNKYIVRLKNNKSYIYVIPEDNVNVAQFKITNRLSYIEEAKNAVFNTLR